MKDTFGNYFPEFGAEHEITTLDEEGSTLKISTSFKGGVAMQPIRKTYEIRVKVRSKQQEMEEYLRFEHETDGKRDKQFRWEGQDEYSTKGYYYIIKSWTENVK